MSPIARASLPLVVICLFSSISAVAAENGSCTHKDSKMVFTDGMAYQKPDAFDEKKMNTIVALTTNKLDPAVISASKNLDHTLMFDIQGGEVTIKIADDKVTSMYTYFPPGDNLTRSGTPFGDLKITSKDPKRVVGSFDLKATSADEVSCHLSFDVPMAR
jgi:hypothetical protein